MLIGPHAFRGDDRFSITRELGRGGMGIVFEAIDRERDETIALKTLHWAAPSAVYRLKQEFRALAGVAHPNLVNLYELIGRDDIWFFTMELVDGTEFHHYVRSGPSQAAVLDVDRLRAALGQLVEGVTALHRGAKVHRDLKPSNVLVAHSGRVVILDFGIAADFTNTIGGRTVEEAIAGTVEYMCPEQCAGQPCTPASDWYSVGVLLYEALTGSPPFTGTIPYILTQKQQVDFVFPHVLAASLPPDLVDLCGLLLRRSPSDRLTGDEVLRELGVSEPKVVLDLRVHGGDEEAVVVGRAAELALLQDAFETSARGKPIVLCIHGESGIGKSTVIEHFVARLARDGDAVVLAGRCYQRESVPYKAVDGVIDRLSRWLRDLPPESVEQLHPDAGALAHVFPALGRIEVIDRMAGALAEVENQRELRRRAFAAFRGMLQSIAEEHPVVIHIDDLQWADRDSAVVLNELLECAGETRLLLILSFRTEDIPHAPFLTQLLEASTTSLHRVHEMGPLSVEEATDYAQSLLGEQWWDVARHADLLAEEADGNPFLLDQIVRFMLDVGTGSGTTSFGLRSMLEARLRQLPDGARELLYVLAVAGQPIEAVVAFRAAGLIGDERPLVATLRIAHLLRSTAGGSRIDLYHDRIRQSFMPMLSAHLKRTIHTRLAEALEAKGVDDPESLYAHYLGAGEVTRAASFAAEAARVAQAALAFERAAQFYQRALDIGPDSAPEARERRVGLGDALASAGRGGDAARAYLTASAGADANTAVDLQRRAGWQLLISGRIDEGLEVIGRVLVKVGLTRPSSPRHALLSLIGRRIRLRLRGLGYRERAAEDLPSAELARVDTCWAVAEGMALVDNIQGAAFQTLHLLLALDAGEPTRVARALAMEAGFVASTGSAVQAAELLDRARELALRVGSHSTLGLCKMIEAVIAFHEGSCEKADQLAAEAQAILATEQSFPAWPLTIARVYHIPILLELGKVGEICRLSRLWLQEALDRGNLFAATVFRTNWGCFVWLVDDDVDGARHALQLALSRHRDGAFYLPDFWTLMAQVLIDLYDGEGEGAYQHVTGVLTSLKKSQLMRIKRIGVRYRHFRAGCAVAAARSHPDRDRLLRVAEQDAQWVERQKDTLGSRNEATGRLLRAAIAVLRANHEEAIRHLEVAVDGFGTAGSRLFHAAATRRLGQMLDNDTGQQMIAEADVWMATQQIRNPARFTRMLAPGFPD